MSTKRTLLVIAYGLILAMLALHAQEKDPSYHQTRIWQLDQNIWIYDTAGVCIYAFYGYQSSAMAAVPKTQLPKGAGCQ